MSVHEAMKAPKKEFKMVCVHVCVCVHAVCGGTCMCLSLLMLFRVLLML